MQRRLILEKRGGNLYLKPTRAGITEAREIVAKRRYGTDDALKFLLVEYLQDGWEWVRPERIGALTSGPIITDEDYRNVKGSRVYWHERYQVDDPIEMFANGETVRFDGAT